MNSIELNIETLKSKKIKINQAPLTVSFYYKTLAQINGKGVEIKVTTLFCPLFTIWALIMTMLLGLVFIVIFYGCCTVLCFFLTSNGSLNFRRTFLQNSQKKFNIIQKNIKETIYSEEDFKFYQNSCAICLTDFKIGCTVSMLICMHAFHKECIHTWIQTRIHEIPRCPMCNLELISEKSLENTRVEVEGAIENNASLSLIRYH